MQEYEQTEGDVDTFIVNPEDNPKKRGKGKGKHRRKGSSARRNPVNNPRRRGGGGGGGKRRGTHRRGSVRNNPGFGTFIPGALGAVTVRAGIKLACGDEGARGTDGNLTSKALIVGALASYFGDRIAGVLRQTGSDAIAFEGGLNGTLANLLIDEKAPDLARSYLVPMAGAGSTAAPSGAGHGMAGLGADRTKPLSTDMYHALAGLGVLPRIGAVVYVQGADGRVYEVPTASGGTAGPEDSIEIPSGAGAGAVILQKSTGRRFRVLRDTSTGQLYAQQISGGVGATVGDYQASA